MLAGGPGQSARDSFPLAAGAFREILRHRDVLLIDQRGTGGSNALRCSSEAELQRLRDADPGPADFRRLAAECAARLDADLRHYTTSDAVRDLESVREALDLERWNLLGISYGTRLGLEYLRRHPQRVRALVLDAVVPPQLALGAEHARNLETALDAQFERCASDPVCRERFGAPRETLDRLIERVRRDPPLVRYRDPFSNAVREESLTPERIAGVARLYAYAPQLGAHAADVAVRGACGPAGDADGAVADDRRPGRRVDRGRAAALGRLCRGRGPAARGPPRRGDPARHRIRRDPAGAVRGVAARHAAGRLPRPGALRSPRVAAFR